MRGGGGGGGLDPHRDGELDGLASLVIAADNLDELLAAEGGAALADLELRAGLIVQDPRRLPRKTAPKAQRSGWEKSGAGAF
jgi:hypothetical protein